MRLFKGTIAVLTLLTASLFANADSVLVGTELTSTNPGPELCPLAANCLVRLSQFTFLTPVVIEDIKVALSGPGLSNTTNVGTFAVNLLNQVDNVSFPPPTTAGNIGSGDLIFSADENPPVTQIFDFSGLDIPLGSGTYYLQVIGANLAWNSATPFATTAGSLGLQLACDPSEPSQCAKGVSSYDVFHGTYAMQISGIEVTPEPSSWVLLGTGITGLAALGRRRCQRL